MTVFPKRLLDVSGFMIGGLFVGERAPNRPAGDVAYYVTCPLGHRHIRLGATIRQAVSDDRLLTCPECRPGRPSQHMIRAEGGKYVPRQAARCCSLCGISGHNIQNCPRSTRVGKLCDDCQGLAWRRPKRGLCVCGERYEAEPPLTLDDILARPSNSRRVEPG